MHETRNVRSAFIGFHLKQVGCRCKLLATFLKLVPETVIVKFLRLRIRKKINVRILPRQNFLISQTALLRLKVYKSSPAYPDKKYESYYGTLVE
jgi:hypothetical protein